MLPIIILMATITAAIPLANDLSQPPRLKSTDLRLRDDKTFHITVFSDLHLGDSSNTTTGFAQDSRTLQVMRDVLDLEKPDFVVLNGDLLTGEAVDRRTTKYYVKQLVKPLVERNLTWGSTYGEHDHTFTVSSDKIRKYERRYDGSRTQKMVKGSMVGTSNYYLLVYGDHCSDGSRTLCKPELILWFFDSRGGYWYRNWTRHGNPVAQYNWVSSQIVDWFLRKNKQLNPYGTIPALAFVHIPIKTTKTLQAEIDAETNPGINDDEPISYQGKSWCHMLLYDSGNERCTFGGYDEAFTTALATSPGMMGLFHGHSHGNTWCRKWNTTIPGTDIKANGLNICFGQRTGYGGYGNWIRGARQITFTKRGREPPGLTTHIRLENGDVVGAVELNTTFNKDVYPATPNNKTYLDTSKNKRWMK